MTGKTLAEIADEVMRQPSGGVITDEVKLDTDLVDAIIDDFRAAEIRLDYQKNRTVHATWLQTYVPTFDSNIQGSGDCLVQFECPPVIHLGDRDGFEYVGTYMNSVNKATLVKLINFPYLGSGGMPSVYSQHRITNRSGLTTWTWLNDTGGFQVIKLYGNKALKNIMVQAIAAKPSAWPGYRREYDMYPISEELLTSMKLKLFKEQTAPMYARPADVISNNQDNANLSR